MADTDVYTVTLEYPNGYQEQWTFHSGATGKSLVRVAQVFDMLAREAGKVPDEKPSTRADGADGVSSEDIPDRAPESVAAPTKPVKRRTRAKAK